MIDLKYFGFFTELGLSPPGGIKASLKLSIGGAAVPETSRILGYLNEGWICMEVFDEQETDVLTGDAIGPLKILTDGEWVWPNLVVHYIAKHGLRVPEELAQRMRSHDWHVPAVPDALFDEIVDTLTGSAADGTWLQEILDMLENEGRTS